MKWLFKMASLKRGNNMVFQSDTIGHIEHAIFEKSKKKCAVSVKVVRGGVQLDCIYANSSGGESTVSQVVTNHMIEQSGDGWEHLTYFVDMVVLDIEHEALMAEIGSV